MKTIKFYWIMSEKAQFESLPIFIEKLTINEDQSGTIFIGYSFSDVRRLKYYNQCLDEINRHIKGPFDSYIEVADEPALKRSYKIGRSMYVSRQEFLLSHCHEDEIPHLYNYQVIELEED